MKNIFFQTRGIGDWGLGIGDWGLGAIPHPQNPIPHNQIPNLKNIKKICLILKIKLK